MTQYDYDIGIIGGGAAGLTVASGAAQLGAKTILVEKEPELGGDCLHYGCVPSKTLIKSAHVYHLMKNGPQFGLPQFDPPPVDFNLVADRIRNVIAVIQKHDSTERFCKLGAKVEFGEARFTDEHAIALNGQTISAKNWVIASGSSPSAPPIPGLAETPHITNKEIFSLKKLPESMIFLGAGPIGIEMAQAFNRLGSSVTVIDRADQILGKEDRDMADGVMAVMANEGVTFHLEAAIELVAHKGGHKTVVIIDKDQNRQTLTAQEIVVAMGRKPNLHGLGLDEIGIEQAPGRHPGGQPSAHQSQAYLRRRGRQRRVPVYPRRRIRRRDCGEQCHFSSAPQGQLHLSAVVYLHRSGISQYRYERKNCPGRRH